MSSLILPRRLRDKPDSYIELDQSHRLYKHTEAYWPLGSVYGARDISKNAIHGTPINSPTNVISSFGDSTLINGTDQQINVPNHTGFAVSAFSLAVKIVPISWDGSGRHAFYKLTGGAEEKLIGVGGGYFKFYAYPKSAILTSNLYQPSCCLPYDVVGTFDGVATWKLYINGALDKTETSATTVGNGNGAAYIGSDGSSSRLNGIFSDLAFYSKALTLDEVQERYYERASIFRAPKRVSYFTTAGGGTNTDSAAGSGSITVTGSASAALRTHLGVAASGSITVTGSAANGVHTTLTNVTSAADAGSIALTGSSANAVRTFLTAAESGAIILVGSAANGIYTPVGAINSDAQSGAISITGTAALGRHDYLAAAGSGSITVTGSSANAIKSLGAVADSGSIAITASNALAIRTWLASADAGSITLTGSSANGVYASTPGTGTLDAATIAAIADAVWSHSSAVQIEQRLTEAWGRLGLDPANPLISGQTEISFGSIVMALTGNQTSSTLTRQ